MKMNSQKSKKGIYLLPNLITTASLFAGFYAVVAATDGRFGIAALSVFIAMLLDTLDGRIARYTKTTSDFGANYDTLADMMSFGIAPALVMYEWALYELHPLGLAWAKLGWLAAFFYVAAAALRLARFNTLSDSENTKFFLGLPSPAAAGFLMSLVWVCNEAGIPGPEVKGIAFIFTILVSVLMVSKFLFYSFKDVNEREKVRFIWLLFAVIILIAITINPPIVLMLLFMSYVASGPTEKLWKKNKNLNTVRSDTSDTEYE